MRTDDFNFDLPEELIAQYPTGERGASRLFVLDRQNHRHIHAMVSDIINYVESGTVMVFNDSRVRKARLYGRACDTGAKVEFLLLAPIVSAAQTITKAAAKAQAFTPSAQWRAMCSKNRRQRIDREYFFPGDLKGRVIGGNNDEKIIEFERPIDDVYLDAFGHM
ncbi:MAG: S-adenosylmethionine:tRNA ribosyltransferase-isomerase, partial [Spirochaetaceae bacterium]|nr:S-adenosylmethionine:tRNA ribosyltransferase-isomerase [Spirochaetaceae bacterium]